MWPPRAAVVVSPAVVSMETAAGVLSAPTTLPPDPSMCPPLNAGLAGTGTAEVSVGASVHEASAPQTRARARRFRSFDIDCHPEKIERDEAIKRI
jgi:hypothetical protein